MAYYRNTITIQNIEPGALWEKQGDTFTLVDEDQLVQSRDCSYFVKQ